MPTVNQMITPMLNGFRSSLRMIRRQPVFAGAVILTFGVGIGSISAGVSLWSAVFSSKLPYNEPESLVVLVGRNVDLNFEEGPVSYPEILDWKERSRLLTGIAAFQDGPTGWSMNLTGGDSVRRVNVHFVGPEYFRTVGASPLLGQTFDPGSRPTAGQSPLAILSHRLWSQTFGSDEGIVGRSLSLNGHPLVVVGVMGQEFEDLAYQRPTDIWVPVTMAARLIHPFFNEREARWLSAIARVTPETSMDAVRAEMKAISASLAEDFPAHNEGWQIRVEPVADFLLGDELVRLSTKVAVAGSLIVLLLVCVNVAGIHLVRTSTREQEISIRRALGGSTARIAFELATESAVLALIGGLLGVVVARWAGAALLVASPLDLPGFVELTLNGQVLAASFVAACLAGMLAGVAPLAYVHGRPGAALGSRRDPARMTPREPTGLRVIVGGEIALATALLVGVGLLVGGHVGFRRVDYGFRTDNLLMARLQLPNTRFEDRDALRAFYRRLSGELGTIAAADGFCLWGSGAPGDNWWYWEVVPEGRDRDVPEDRIQATIHRISPGSLAKLGIRLSEGRRLRQGDGRTGGAVAIVSESFAREAWPGSRGLGKEIVRPTRGEDTRFTVVGIAADVRHRGRRPEDHHPYDIYLPLHQNPTDRVTIVLRTRSDPETTVAQLRETVRRVDPELPLFDVGTMAERMHEEESDTRFYAFLSGAFGITAIALLAMGVFSMLDYGVRARTREIGVRRALGATPKRVLRTVLAKAVIDVGLGLAIGSLAAGGLCVALERTALDPRLIPDPLLLVVTSSSVVLAVALASAVRPAVRALAIDPAEAIRGHGDS